MKKTSCGILLRRNDGKYLIGHSTGHGPTNSWTVFKGMQEEGETNKETAYREFKEETSIDLAALGLKLEPFDTYALKDKQVVIFLCVDADGVTGWKTPKCNSYVRDNFPEIDEFKWVDLDEGYTLVCNSQKHLFE